MLNKKRTNNARKVKYLALVPMAAGLLLLNNIDAMARVLNEKVAEVIQQPTALATTTVSKMEAANPLPPEKDKIYDTCDIMPEFPGGQNALLQFLAKSIKYPAELQSVTDTIVVCAIGGSYAGYLLLADALKDDAKTAIDNLKALNIENIQI